MDTIMFFSHTGDFGVFSQWYLSPFSDEEFRYNTAEQYMMVQKAILFGDIEMRNEILEKKAANEVKKLGRKVKNFSDEIWNAKKLEIVIRGNYLKFSQNPELRKILLNTGDAILAEASPYDSIWGIGCAAKDVKAKDMKNWGENLLGKALMAVRTILSYEYPSDKYCDIVLAVKEEQGGLTESDMRTLMMSLPKEEVYPFGISCDNLGIILIGFIRKDSAVAISYDTELIGNYVKTQITEQFVLNGKIIKKKYEYPYSESDKLTIKIVDCD